MLNQSPFLRVGDVARLTGISEREVWRKSSSDPDFPKSRKQSSRRTVWLREEVTEYIEKVKAALA